MLEGDYPHMEVKVETGSILLVPSELAAIGVVEDAALPSELQGLLEPRDFRGRSGQTLLLYPRSAAAPRRVLLVGLGKAEKLNGESLRRAAATAVQRARELQVSSFTIGAAGELPGEPAQAAQALAEGLVLGGYRYWHYRTGLTEEQTFTVQFATLVVEANEEAVRSGAAAGEIIGRGVAFARDLVNSPGGVLTPPAMAQQALELGERVGLKVRVWEKSQLLEEGFGGILAVGGGSANDPRFIVMEYGEAAEGRPTICLVGKGLTFDSGGLSLKPADAMETMKCDMGGAAAVFGAMQVAAELKLPLHLVGLISSAENMPSATAYRPGDVIKSLSGKTIEVLNTDAEGRIILSDALFYAQRYNPSAIIELSTLTGAVIIALGTHATGMMGTDQALMDKLSAAGEASGERVWPLPLWDEYHEMIKSEIADIKNIGGRAAGSITAGAFLAAFVGDFPFVHFDIAGTAWAERSSKSYETQGGTGVGVRLLTEYLRDQAV
jgi:leucyl aminopeptidase